MAVSLVCERLTRRTDHRDRSLAEVIAMASRRNREHIAGARAVLKTAALEKADFGNERFDKVFARQRRALLASAKRTRWGSSGGISRPWSGYFFWDARHTQPGRARDLPERLSEKIRLAWFSVNQVLVKDLRPVPAVCVICAALKGAAAADA